MTFSANLQLLFNSSQQPTLLNALAKWTSTSLYHLSQKSKLRRRLIAFLETSSHQHQSKLSPSTQASFSTLQEWKQIELNKCLVRRTPSLRPRLTQLQLHKTHQLPVKADLMLSCDKCALTNTINADLPLYNNFLQSFFFINGVLGFWGFGLMGRSEIYI